MVVVMLVHTREAMPCVVGGYAFVILVAYRACWFSQDGDMYHKDCGEVWSIPSGWLLRL